MALGPREISAETESVPSVYITMGFGVLPSTHDQHRRIIVMSRHEYYYPTQIAVVDANGKTLSEYWHSGHLFHFKLASLEGREESSPPGSATGISKQPCLSSIPIMSRVLNGDGPTRGANPWHGARTRGFACCSREVI